MKRSTSRWLVWGAWLVPVLVVFGCLPFPLGDPQKSRVDPGLEGYWLHEQPGQSTLISLYPFDEHAYVLESHDVERTGDGLHTKGRLLAKAWLTDINGHRFITLEPLAQKLASATDQKFYPVFLLSAQGSVLGVRPVHEEFEPFKTARSAKDVEQIIRREIDNPALYRDKASYRHLDPRQDEVLINSISNAP